MNTRKSHGFTIIETTLFLMISGILIVGLIAGAGTSLNTQRYRDSVETFKSLLQSQFTELSNIQNARNNNWTCNSNASVVEGGSTRRGQSNCMMLGKYVYVDRDTIRTYRVTGVETSTVLRSDIDTLRQNFAINATPVDERKLEWGTQIAWARTGADSQASQTPRNIGILFLRSPTSGSVYVFTSNQVTSGAVSQAVFTNLLSSANAVPGRAARVICVSSGGLVASGDRAVTIGSYASATSAIEVKTNEIMRNEPALPAVPGSPGGQSQC